MSKNTVDRRKSTFKARDNVEIIMNKIFTFIESNLSSETESTQYQCWSSTKED